MHTVHRIHILLHLLWIGSWELWFSEWVGLRVMTQKEGGVEWRVRKHAWSVTELWWNILLSVHVKVNVTSLAVHQHTPIGNINGGCQMLSYTIITSMGQFLSSRSKVWIACRVVKWSSYIQLGLVHYRTTTETTVGSILVVFIRLCIEWLKIVYALDPVRLGYFVILFFLYKKHGSNMKRQIRDSNHY